MSSRETFCAVVAHGPLVRGDAVVVLSGDGDKRLAVGLEIFEQRAAPLIVVSGGVDNPPHSLSAQASAEWLIDKGVAPDRVIQEDDSRHTYDQAVAVVGMAHERGWLRLLLVTSPYHQYRAFLTFLRELHVRSKAEAVHLLSVPACQTLWWEKPAGSDTHRVDLLEAEFTKIEEYRAHGHVASYEDGLKYLEFWESNQQKEQAA